jgi:peptide/nickel transport system substrate-binding protein
VKHCFYTLPLLLTLALCLFVPLSLTGCRRPGPPKDVLVVALNSDPLYLNPVIASEGTSQQVNAFIFNALLKFNEHLELVGDLAESWKSSKDEKTWTFTLKKNITWHDGAPFTAEDVAFTFDRLFDPAINTYNRGLFMVEGKKPDIKVIDPCTIQFCLPRPFAPFVSNLALMPIIPLHLLKGKDLNHSEFNWHPIGTGPFMFKEWKASERLYLVANPHYFCGAPLLKGVSMPIIPSAESRRIALMTDTVDTSTLSTEDMRAVKTMKNIQVFQWQQYDYDYLGFDLTKALFQDINVRKAINYAIDKDTIVKAVLQGTGKVATGPIPIASWAYSDDVEKYSYNPEKARSLLISSGWSPGKDRVMTRQGKKLEFEIRYRSGNPAAEKASVIMQAYLMEAGIKVNLRATEFSALLNSCNPGQFEAVILDWIENCDPDNFTEWHSSQMGDKGMNYMSYQNPKVDRILEEARSLSDRAKRKKLYSELQQIVVNDAPYVFLWNPDYVVAVNRRVHGLPPPGPAGLFTDLEKLYVR